MDTELKPGIYVCGRILTVTGNLYNRKDGSGQFVRVRHEISTRPGMIEYEQVLDPAKDAGIKIEGGKLVAFPSIPEDSLVTLRVEPGGLGSIRAKSASAGQNGSRKSDARANSKGPSGWFVRRKPDEPPPALLLVSKT